MELRQSKRFRNRDLIKPLSTALALSSMLLGITASAATGDMVQTWSQSHTDPTITDPSNPLKLTPVSTVFGTSTPSWGWPNLPIPSTGGASLDTANHTGRYRVNLNYWNLDNTQGNVMSSAYTINVNDQSGLYSIKSAVNGNSYYSGVRPQDNLACANPGDTQDVCHWVPNVANPSAKPIHAPAAFPSIYNGCHYNQCSQDATTLSVTGSTVGTTTVRGGPYPLRVNQITSIPSHWIVDTSARKSTGVFDVAYDIWLDKNPNRDASGNIVSTGGTPQLPAHPELVNQNNGLEIMIWINNGGYKNGGTGGIITPAGNLVATAVAIPGISGTWDVWATTAAKAGKAPNDWFIVSYVNNNPTDDFQFDSKYFINDSATRTCFGNEKCAQPTWYLTSIQAGFEIWADGEGLVNKSFTADPTWLQSTVQGGALWKNPDGTNVSDPAHNNGNPVSIVYWGHDFDVTAICPNPSPNDSGTWTFAGTDPTNGTTYSTMGPMKADATGVLVGTVTAPYPVHEWATLTVAKTCVYGGSGTQTTDFWVDPAGTVKTTNGAPLVGAKVTLYRSTSATGTFTAVPDGSTIMSDKNRKNPDGTGLYGDFSWDVTPGFYKVRAEYPGCYKPGASTTKYVESAVYQVPPPALGINLILECPNYQGGGSNGVGVKLTTNGTDWQNGYCRNLVLTNTTSKAITWKVTFNLPFPNSTVDRNNKWNLNYTQSGNTVTAWGVGWNNVIQPGQVLKDQGFCATK